MRRNKWQKTYSQLRKLVHDPQVRVSGPFVRVWADDKEFIFNARRNRLIAEIIDGKKLVLQQSSLYNQPLLHLYDGLEVATDAIPQITYVRAVARILLAKEKGQFHAKEITKPQGPGPQRRNPYEFIVHETWDYNPDAQIASAFFGNSTNPKQPRDGNRQLRAITRAFGRCRASIRRYLDRFTASEHRYTGGRTERDFSGGVGYIYIDRGGR